MPRAKGSSSRTRKKKVMKAVKGNFGGRSKLYRTARETLLRSLAYAYRDRRVRKREFRALWIARINAAARGEGLSYSRFLSGLKKAGVDVDRKMLSELAIHEPSAFRELVELAKSSS